MALVKASSLFADLPSQSKAIGEFEAAFLQYPDLTMTAIGAVLVGDKKGRVSVDQITVFDSSGIALQDLSIANKVIDLAIARGLVADVEF